MHRRAYFHASSALFVVWLLIEPLVRPAIDECWKVAESRRR